MTVPEVDPCNERDRPESAVSPGLSRGLDSIQYDERHRWLDPFPEVHGVLLSDYIELYSRASDLIKTMDSSVVRDHIEAASYTLRVGPSQYANGEETRLEAGGTIKIPPNGLVYVATLEEINIPYYMIARMNLRVKQVYRGLLLGTGPQVDPGFSGHLNCPIHNLTDSEKTLHYGDKLATIDFIKTTPFGTRTALEDIATEAQLEASRVVGHDSVPLIMWKGDLARHHPLLGENTITPMLPPGESVRSSLSDLANRLRQIETNINDDLDQAFDRFRVQMDTSIDRFQGRTDARIRNTQFLGLGVLAALAIALVVIVFQLQQNVANALIPSDTTVARIRQDLDQLRTQIAGIPGANGTPPPTGTPIPGVPIR